LPWPQFPPWAEVVDAATRIALPAGGLAFAIPLATRWIFGRAAMTIATPLGAAVGLATAFALREAAPWRPDDFGSGWVHVAWAAALVGGAAAALLSFRWSWLLKLAAVALAAYVTVPMERRDGPWWFVALAAVMALPWLAVPANDSEIKRQWPERLVWLGLALGALSVVALHAHYLRATDFAMMAACAVAGGAVASTLLGRDGHELEGLGYVTLPALVLCTWNDTESAIPTAAFACAGLAVAPMAVFRWFPRAGWRGLLVRGAIVMIPAVVAAILAMTFEEVSFG